MSIDSDSPTPPLPLACWRAPVPIASLLGAVESIQRHHQAQLEEHRSCASCGSDDGGDATSSGPEAAAAAAVGPPPPAGYPGTCFLAAPLRGTAANTRPRMWNPPPGPGYPPGPGFYQQPPPPQPGGYHYPSVYPSVHGGQNPYQPVPMQQQAWAQPQILQQQQPPPQQPPPQWQRCVRGGGAAVDQLPIFKWDCNA